MGNNIFTVVAFRKSCSVIFQLTEATNIWTVKICTKLAIKHLHTYNSRFKSFHASPEKKMLMIAQGQTDNNSSA